MDMGSGSNTGDCEMESRERDAIGAQKFHQRLPRRAIRIQTNIHRIVVVIAPAIVQR